MLALYLLADRRDAAGVALLIEQAGAIEQPDERAAALSILHGRYAHLDPAAALRHVQRQSAADAEPWLTAVFRVWACSDLAAALRHAETLGEDRRTIAGAAILQARDDLPQAARAEIAARLAPRGALLREVVDWPLDGSLADAPALAWRQVAAAYARHHPEEAVAWAAARADGIWTMRDVFTALSHEDTERAARLLALVEDADARRAAEHVLVGRWAGDDPRAALAWLNRHPDPDRRAELHSSLLCAWAVGDLAGAMRHVDGLADPRTRRGLVLDMFGYALHSDYGDIFVAEKLLDHIEPADVRRKAAAELDERLSKIDPDWLARHRR